MASPSQGEQKERLASILDGFNLVARELDRALCYDLNGDKAFILEYIREESYYKSLIRRRRGEPLPDPIPARVNVSLLALDSGKVRTTLGYHLRALKRARIIIEVEPGFYLINKDYTTWMTDDGKRPRFDARALAWIRKGRGRRRESTAKLLGCTFPDGNPVADDDNPIATDAGNPIAITGNPVATPDDNPIATPLATPLPDAGNAVASDRQPDCRAHIEDRACVDSTRLETTSSEGEREDGRSLSKGRRRAVRADVMRVLPGPHSPSPIELARVFRFIEAHCPGRFLDTKIAEHSKRFPVAWFLKVLKRGTLKGVDLNWGWVERLLTTWSTTGPESGPEDAVDDDLNPIPTATPSSPQQATRPGGTENATTRRAKLLASIRSMQQTDWLDDGPGGNDGD